MCTETTVVSDSGIINHMIIDKQSNNRFSCLIYSFLMHMFHIHTTKHG